MEDASRVKEQSSRCFLTGRAAVGRHHVSPPRRVSLGSGAYCAYLGTGLGKLLRSSLDRRCYDRVYPPIHIHGIDTMQPVVEDDWGGGERVCDRCRVKKTKCNRQKPTCSRCSENHWECTYSAIKRKPGPPKGYTAAKRRATLGTSHLDPSSPDPVYSDLRDTSIRPSTASHQADLSGSNQSGSTTSTSNSQWKGYELIEAESLSSPTNGMQPRPQLSAEAERELVDAFFRSIQPHYPLFQKPKFLTLYNTDLIQGSLLAAVFAVSIATSSNPEIASLGFRTVGDTYALYAWQACSDIVLYGSPAGPDDLKTLFLLGLYEFRNSPNRKAWNVTGHLVRQAYHYGLHQIESPGGCSFIDQTASTASDLEELRYLWWSIYTLDTCCNLTIATPSNIDLDMVNTYLPCTAVEHWTSGQPIQTRKDRLLLRSDIEGVSELVMRTSQSKDKMTQDSEGDLDFIIRIINTSILRETSNVRQMAVHNTASRVQQRWQAQFNIFAALRLSLPADYLNPRRNLALAESPKSHALRLVTLMEVSLGQLWLSLPKRQDRVGSKPWLMDWCAAVDVTDKIVNIVQQWDPATLHLADPAIGYIVFIFMVIVRVHNRLDRGGTGFTLTGEKSHDSWHLLKLFLLQLSNYWLLSKALYGKLFYAPAY